MSPKDIILAHHIGNFIGPADDGMGTKVGDIGILSHLSQSHALTSTSDQQRDTGLLYWLARQTSLLWQSEEFTFEGTPRSATIPRWSGSPLPAPAAALSYSG